MHYAKYNEKNDFEFPFTVFLMPTNGALLSMDPVCGGWLMMRLSSRVIATSSAWWPRTAMVGVHTATTALCFSLHPVSLIVF